MKEVITFFGAEAKVGTTMIAQSFTEDLVSKGNTALLIYASGEMYDTYIPEKAVKEPGIDELRELELKDIDKPTAKKLIRTHNGFDYIKGAEVPLQVCYFDPGLINKVLVPLFEKDYDYIVIDGGHNLNYPLPVSAILAATKLVYVTKSKNRAVYRLRDERESTISLLRNNADIKEISEILVINDYSKSEAIVSLDIIKATFNIPQYNVPHVNLAAACEATSQTLMKVNRQFRDSISDLTKKILE